MILNMSTSCPDDVKWWAAPDEVVAYPVNAPRYLLAAGTVDEYGRRSGGAHPYVFHTKALPLLIAERWQSEGADYAEVRTLDPAERARDDQARRDWAWANEELPF